MPKRWLKKQMTKTNEQILDDLYHIKSDQAKALQITNHLIEYFEEKIGRKTEKK